MPFNWNATWAEQASAPDTPATGKWKLYPKADGFYALEDDGTEHGPFSSESVAVLTAATELTISAGSVTATQSHHTIDTQANAASDDLDTINGGVDGELLYIRAEADDRTVVLKHGTGNIYTPSGGDVTMSTYTHYALLIYDSTVSGWIVINEDSADATATGEIFLSAAGMWPSTTSGCAANAKTEYGTNDVDLYTLDFDASTEEYAQVSVWMPDDWDAGTVTAKFAWTAASSTGDVIWALQGRAYANDDAIDQAWGTAQTVTDTLLATGDVHYTSATSAITLAGTPAAGELVQFRVYRDADAGGDTLAADAKLLGVKITYTKS